MSIIWKITDWLLERLKNIGAICLVGMMALTCVDVVGRYLGHPIFGSVELVGYMAIIAVGAALPYTHQAKAHIGVEILTRLLSERVQTIIDICTGVASLVLFIIITWRMMVYAETMQNSGEVSMNLEFPEYIIIYIISVCFLVSCLSIFRDIFNNIKLLRGHK
ncbi:MAG: TRAP transporter small permease [Desulfobacterales bacterium]|nr:TRAP transporter small permease [Desulfobacterales bacterium]